MRFLHVLQESVLYILAPISPELCSCWRYWRAFKRPLNLSAPMTLNEKLMWLKLEVYKNDPLVTQCADKFAVRDFVRSSGCGDTLNELYGVWDRPEDIIWEELPMSFVMKCNHGCGYNILCKDRQKLDVSASERQLKRWQREDFWRRYAELQYKNIPKKIICERFLGEALLDYKIYCFHGQPRYIMVCQGRNLGVPRFYFFDTQWRFCPITRDGQREQLDFTLPKPRGLEQMLECARRLSAPFYFVRVDMYDVDGAVIFGELTFTPGAALDSARLPETDLLFGSMLHLPEGGIAE